MSEEELSKRIDYVHKRLDNLRGDTNRRFEELRADMNRPFDEVWADMNPRFHTLTWLTSG